MIPIITTESVTDFECMVFLGLWPDSDGVHGRIKVYTGDLSMTADTVIKKLARLAANGVEEWTKSSRFLQMGETERIEYLCGKDLLIYTGSAYT